ncbi:MAG: tyrosine recombinase XerC [Candidatus Tenebribacter mawsonii]|nr:tyrosine recombinase XerC [Candidatus Tenebribacter mawsonii]
MVEVINDYMNFLIARGLSKLTIKTYRSDLDQLFNFLAEQLGYNSIDIVTRTTMRLFIAWLNQNKLSNRSISRKISTTKEFFKFCVRYHHIDEDPTKKLIHPKFSTKLPKVFTIKEMFDLLKIPDLSTKFGLRDQAILEILYSSGLRISEVVNITFADLDLDSQILTVHGKGSKDRRVPIGRLAIIAISKYLMIRHKFVKEDSKFIFLTKFGKPFSTNSLREVLNKYIKKFAKTEGYTVHSIRHSFATHMLEQGAHLSTVQKILGHENPTTTQIYTQLSIVYQREAIRKYHPINHSERDQFKLAFYN